MDATRCVGTLRFQVSLPVSSSKCEVDFTFPCLFADRLCLERATSCTHIGRRAPPKKASMPHPPPTPVDGHRCRGASGGVCIAPLAHQSPCGVRAVPRPCVLCLYSVQWSVPSPTRPHRFRILGCQHAYEGGVTANTPGRLRAPGMQLPVERTGHTWKLPVGHDWKPQVRSDISNIVTPGIGQPCRCLRGLRWGRGRAGDEAVVGVDGEPADQCDQRCPKKQLCSLLALGFGWGPWQTRWARALFGWQTTRHGRCAQAMASIGRG